MSKKITAHATLALAAAILTTSAFAAIDEDAAKALAKKMTVSNVMPSIKPRKGLPIKRWRSSTKAKQKVSPP